MIHKTPCFYKTSLQCKEPGCEKFFKEMRAQAKSGIWQSYRAKVLTWQNSYAILWSEHLNIAYRLWRGEVGGTAELPESRGSCEPMPAPAERSPRSRGAEPGAYYRQ